MRRREFIALLVLTAIGSRRTARSVMARRPAANPPESQQELWHVRGRAA
jgi:hypothetical protein